LYRLENGKFGVGAGCFLVVGPWLNTGVLAFCDVCCLALIDFF